VTTVHRQQGNTSISIANIDNLHNFAHIDIQQHVEEEGELLPEEGGDDPELDQVINLEIQIDQQDLNINNQAQNNIPQA